MSKLSYDSVRREVRNEEGIYRERKVASVWMRVVEVYVEIPRAVHHGLRGRVAAYCRFLVSPSSCEGVLVSTSAVVAVTVLDAIMWSRFGIGVYAKQI